MPRGKKRNPTGRTKRDRIPVTDGTNARAEELARKLGIINPRTGNGNRSELVERVLLALAKTYPHCLPKQNELMLWLLGLCDRDDIPLEVREAALTWADYLESWGIEQNLEEAMAEGVSKTPGGSWII